jgi:hypothetical protein
VPFRRGEDLCETNLQVDTHTQHHHHHTH